MVGLPGRGTAGETAAPDSMALPSAALRPENFPDHTVA